MQIITPVHKSRGAKHESFGYQTQKNKKTATSNTKWLKIANVASHTE